MLRPWKLAHTMLQLCQNLVYVQANGSWSTSFGQGSGKCLGIKFWSATWGIKLGNPDNLVGLQDHDGIITCKWHLRPSILQLGTVKMFTKWNMVQS